MPRFAPVAEFLGESLELPVEGRDRKLKEYAIPPCAAEVGLKLTARFDDAKTKVTASDDPDEEVVDDASEEELYRMALGDVYDQLIADGVLFPTLKVVGQTAVIWHVYGVKAAELYWEVGGDPKRFKKDSTSTTETPATPAAAPSTRKRASATGTTRSRSAKPRSGPTSSEPGTS